jgi:TolB-like protein
MSFIITDAPAHLDYKQEFTYYHAVKSAREKGVKVFSIGTGGLDIKGEYVLRQISQYTGGKYIFLTYGEKGESEGGREGSVSHHTGANFQTDKLESIIIRFARDELNNVLDKKIEIDEHFSAKKVDYEKNEETLRKLFGMAASQLVDYSSMTLQAKTPTSILPIESSDPGLKTTAEYFGEQLSFSLAKSPAFAIVERKNLQGILKELELSLSGLTDEANAAKVGKLLGARLLVTGKLYRKKNEYELFLKLVRVETAEVLSVTKARLDFELGLLEDKTRQDTKKMVKTKNSKKQK